MIEKLGNKSLVVLKNGIVIFESDKERLRPVVDCMNHNDMGGSVVIDKVVGLAAAKLFDFAEVKKVYAVTASKRAVEYLSERIMAEKVVERIMNDDKTEICPMERLAEKLTGKELFEKLNK